MAIRHSITLSTSEPNNEVGNLKIRQGDEQTQTLVANITENGVPKPFVGLQPFFCAKLGQTAGLGIIEQKVTGPMNPANGTLEYIMQPEDWQQIGRQTAYFSFRKMVNDHEWTEQFSTRDFNYNVIKSAFSEGLREVKKDGSTYVWTIEDMLRLFKEYMATGKIDWENYKNDERTIWEKFVEDNREFLENADPGGKIILELLGGRGEFDSLGDRLDGTDAQLSDIAKHVKPTASGDDTAYLQSIFDNYEKIVIKRGTYFVNALTRLNVPSNRHIEWEHGAVFQILTTYAEGYKGLWIADKENVTLINPVILGERDSHIGTTGEYGFGIHIERSRNVKVFNPTCNKMWGDGIIITDGEDVLIDQPICNDNRRQGMTISGKNIVVRDPILTNSNGTPPQSGIDIEPMGDARVENIRIINPKTENCVGNGIHVNLEHIANTNRPISITILNHEDNRSSSAFEVYRLPNGLKGFIKYTDAVTSNNKLAGISINNCSSENDVTIKIDNPTIINPNEKNNIPGKYGAGIAIFRETAMTSSYILGNIVITNPTIIDNRATSQLYRGIEVIDEKSIGFKNIKIVDPLEIKGLQNSRDAISVDHTGVSVLDSLGVTANKISESMTLHSRQSISKIETIATTITPTIAMGAVKKVNIDTLTLEVGTGHGIIFKPDPTEVIRPISTVSGQSIKSMQVGASITLKKKSITTWIVTQIIGEWTTV